MSKFITSDPPYNAGPYPTNVGFLELAGGVALSSTLTNVTDQSNNASALYLSINQVKIGNGNQFPLILSGPDTLYSAIFNTGLMSKDNTFTFPDASLTFAGIDIAQTFTGANTFSGFNTFNGVQQLFDAPTAPDKYAVRIKTDPYTIGNATQNHPVLLLGTAGSSIWAASPNGGTYIGINAVASFPGNFLDFHVSGGASVFKVSYTGSITGGSPSSTLAKLNLKGDGATNIARFENSGGTQAIAINNNGAITIARESNIGPIIYPFKDIETTQDILGFGLGFTSNKVNFSSNNYDVLFTGQNYTTTSGIANYVTIRRTFAAAAGTASFRPLNIEYTINNSGAQTGGATATGIFLNATETALNGMGHALIDLQVGGSSKFKVSNGGLVNTTTIAASNSACNRYSDSSSGGINWAFVNSTTAAVVYQTTGLYSALTTDVINTSAIFELRSTTKGFLPPVMTTTQKNAISSPATGLVIFDSTLGKLCVYGGASWQTVTSV